MDAAVKGGRLLLAGGLVVDGSGAPPRRANVLLEGDRIAAVGPSESIPSGVPRIDVSGRVVAPGFIDSHTHDDGYLLAHPDMKPKVSQGITTVVTGNCGISLAPLVRQALPQPLDLLGPAELFRFPTFRGWIEALRASSAAVNVIPLVGHTTLRVNAMQDTQRAATPQEIEQMRGLLSDALQAGAFGMSTGTFYPPAAHAPTEEIIQVGQPLRAHGGLYATHLRDEADQIVSAMDEALEIGRALDCLVVFSHHKLAGGRNHGRSVETLGLLEHAARLQPVCLDCHPYPATSTMLRLDRVRIAQRTLITWSGGYPQAQGRDFADVQRELGLDDEQTLQRLSPAGAIYFLMDPADVERIMAHPFGMVGSDGLPFDKHPHPRQWGTFTNVLRTLVRERQVLSLEAAIHKMTGLAAMYYGVPDRGLLAPGHKADVVVLDAARVTDRATFEQPIQASEGIEQVFVNGQRVWDGERTTGALPGRVLARSSGRA
ncbi:N-acyl-D-amino-acid deacylase family protein [Ramlibacter tataouinensis]|uniref:Candidate N-acyl-D-aspartate deacylase (N-acyl-D-aspartate amidohydrolase) n=1 Tax=Ramlibacter tataouinensis (strain ATCC BAA-407 / DSM 14655 / LMG 21543 / TTB310) TaxID=365046 RepID=F5Y3L4_RAMTT|nr:D-aminoacylase [Ramlibacter tataouinensis]AEG92488.1 candidate N-acyl-D-aspartate deacylase (N-acyl-D-aspartate amidohydrolase) [Ramlibacter tataouinensis TTB310]